MLNANMRQRLSGIARSLFVAVLMFATLFPFYWTLLISLKNQSDAFQVPPDLIFMPTLENYEELFVTGSFGRYFFNSFVVCVLSIILALLVGIPSAYIFARCEFRFKKAFFYVLLITRMSPRSICDSLLYCLQRTGIIGYLYRLDADLFRVKLGNHCVESESFYGRIYQ